MGAMTANCKNLENMAQSRSAQMRRYSNLTGSTWVKKRKKHGIETRQSSKITGKPSHVSH